MSTRTLLILAELSFELGLIDVNEHEERCRVARWIAEDESATGDTRDPREPPAPEVEQSPTADEPAKIKGSGKVDEPEWLELNRPGF
jgi:hypothetical protein